MKLRIFAIVLVGFIVTIGACKSGDNNGKITSDLINNPNSATGDIDKSKLPAFKFKETEHNFGQIMQGEKVSFAFRFENVGKSDLLISNAKASCGCTVPEYPKKPIKPGEEGSILVTFDSGNRRGMQNKSIQVHANTQPNIITLRIKAQVMENLENEIVKIGG